MSKKLLEESTIRSFMKLANLQPLSDKFIKESWKQEESLNEEEDEKNEKKVEESEALEEETLEEVVEEADEEKMEEGKESEGRPASPKQKVAGVAKPGKMNAAKNAPGDAKLTAAKHTTHHSDKPDSIEHSKKSNAPKKNKGEFEIVSESLEETSHEGMEEQEMETPEDGDTPSADAGEGGDHQEKMKGLIRQMLENLKQMGEEYGMSMEISDEGASQETPDMGAVEASPESPADGADDEMMQEKLDEMVEKLTKRVASRLVKESKKRS